ncbi:MAG: hypothetical protein ACLQVX_05865 [Limisphaerales bacterium]
MILASALAPEANVWLNPNANTMRRSWICLSFGRTARAVTAALALLLMFALGLVAASPSLHQQFQTDSNHPGHFCFICAFAGGQMALGDKTPVVAAVWVFLVCGLLAAETPLASLFDFSSSLSRAPPRA